jgi:hypothetical protein
MKTYAVLLIAALALVPVAGALATPSTLVTIPSTDILPNATWHLDVDHEWRVASCELGVQTR